jgi:hypothetical protein
MSRWFGKVGFSESTEIDPENNPGVWDDVITEREYYGDVVRNIKKMVASQDSTLSDYTLNLSISIVSDAYSYSHLSYIKYVEYQGALWAVSEVTPDTDGRPRLTLTMGGIYNGPRPQRTPQDTEGNSGE